MIRFCILILMIMLFKSGENIRSFLEARGDTVYSLLLGLMIIMISKMIRLSWTLKIQKILLFIVNQDRDRDLTQLHNGTPQQI